MSEELSQPPEIQPELKAKASLIQILLPIGVTSLIFWWILNGIDFDTLKSAMTGISWLEVGGVVGVFCLWMFITDIFSFGAGLKWLVDPRTPWKDILMLRSSTIFAAVIFPPLGEVFAPYYFYRKWNRSILRTLGAVTFVVIVDSSTFSLSLLCAFLFFDTSMVSQLWLIILIGQSTFLVTLAFAFSRFGLPFLPKFFKERDFFFAIRNADFWITFKIFLIRISTFIAVCFTLFYLLRVLKIDISVSQALLFIPLFMASIFLPISAGGYGGPQGAAVLFLVQLWDLCSAEQALAFSLLWSTFFLIGRAAISGIFILPAWKMLQELKPVGD